jgi:hypothetical protein
MSDFCDMAESLRRMDEHPLQWERARNRQRIEAYGARVAAERAKNPADFERRFIRGLNDRDALLTFYPRNL